VGSYNDSDEDQRAAGRAKARGSDRVESQDYLEPLGELAFEEAQELEIAFAGDHELKWTTDPIFEDRKDCRAYCRCGWVHRVPRDTAILQRLGFIQHLEELNDDV